MRAVRSVWELVINSQHSSASPEPEHRWERGSERQIQRGLQSRAAHTHQLEPQGSEQSCRAPPHRLHPPSDGPCACGTQTRPPGYTALGPPALHSACTAAQTCLPHSPAAGTWWCWGEVTQTFSSYSESSEQGGGCFGGFFGGVYLVFTSVELTLRIFIGIADPVPRNTISG